MGSSIVENRDFPDERINEVYAGAGPYDHMAFFDFFMNNDNLYGRTGFVPYTFRGICYGENITVDYSKIYNPWGPANILHQKSQ